VCPSTCVYQDSRRDGLRRDFKIWRNRDRSENDRESKVKMKENEEMVKERWEETRERDREEGE
jgi:hypothetical protein